MQGGYNFECVDEIGKCDYSTEVPERYFLAVLFGLFDGKVFGPVHCKHLVLIISLFVQKYFDVSVSILSSIFVHILEEKKWLVRFDSILKAFRDVFGKISHF